jgi:hypothetical protein
MKKNNKQWKFIKSGTEINTILFGVNIFDYKWINTGEKVSVKDPLYGQGYFFSIYKVLINDKEYEFACGEFSNGVYGFFEYK